MTLSSTLTKVQYNGDDATTAFAVSFIFYTDADLRVILTVTATGVETVQALTTNYTLSGGDGATGTLTMLTAPATGETLTIKSNIDDTQELSLPEGGVFPSSSVERRLDIITRLVQQQAEEIARAVLLNESSETGSINIPDPEAGKALLWNAAADALENSTDDFNDIVTDAETAQTAAEAAQTAAEAAQTAAELAETNAETAQTAAELAETNAETAQTAAELAETNAETAQTAAELAETNAETAQTAAELAETNAESAEANAEDLVNTVAFSWNFLADTDMVDPGGQNFQVNNATLSSVTQMAISDVTRDAGIPNVSDFLATWDDSSSSIKGYIIMRKLGTPATFAIFQINATITDNTTWFQMPLTYIDGSGTFSASDDIFMTFIRNGDLATIDWTIPGTIGSITPNTGNFTTLDLTGAFTSLGIDDNADANAMTIDSSEDISYVGAAQYAAGQGVVFNGDSIDAAHTLDDYEEGTWTPVFQGTTGSIGATAYAVRLASYTKIGNLVRIKGVIIMSNLGSWTGDVQISGLPFTTSSLEDVVNVVVNSGASITANQVITGIGASASTLFNLRLWDATTGVSSLLVSEVLSTFFIWFNTSYEVS